MKQCRIAAITFLILLMGAGQPICLMAEDWKDRERDLSRVRKKIETLRAWQLTEELDLDEETSSRLFPAMNRADRERWDIETRNRKLVREMSRALRDRDPDPGRINRILDELKANRRELIRSEERHIEAVRKILSPADTARYLIFQIKFQTQIKQKAAQALRDRYKMGDNDGRMFRDRFEDENTGVYGSDSGGGSSGGGNSKRR